MKIRDVKLRLVIRGLCKYAKHLGLELESVVAILEEEWDRA
jgi:hypothetical protein